MKTPGIERVTLGRIEVLADRLDALGKRADAAIADPDTSASKVSMLANVARQYEVSMHALIKSLDPTMEVQAKSARHRDAAMKRWHGSAS
ncbi:hypothetical protein [Mycobacterium sp.]|jgi:hypothetical protein|uniref:hypothetical protein n=1 Tax=Mycobacterium sp. TaxID=1785 RepID=UPI002BA0FFDC|nr:hypothetical protein [Mycobacterium sp.]HTH87331.1 hypothetical protein [Mycobacterium sp.]